jgi:N-methylhydantoinase B
MVMDHGRVGPNGALGGRAGGVNRVTVERGADTYTPPHLSKAQDIELQAGDCVRVSTPGGGGYGDPYQRDPVLVVQDLVRGYYSRDQARELFGVMVTDDLVLDETATAELRAKPR